jgi:molybdopterin synthase sulfur carrier subunit
MKIKIKTFASLKDIFGFSEKSFDLPENITAGQAVVELKKIYPDFNSYNGLLLIARNEEFCNEDQVLKDSDVIAVFPPVSGG